MPSIYLSITKKKNLMDIELHVYMEVMIVACHACYATLKDACKIAYASLLLEL